MGQTNQKCIFPRLIISGKICSYRYEYPRDLVSVFKVRLHGIIHLGVFAGGYSKFRFVSTVSAKVKYIELFMAEGQQERSSNYIISGQPSATAPIPTDLGAILDAQKQAILSAVNSQIQNLQSNLLTAQVELSSRIAAESQADNYVFKKKGNEQQFKFNQKVIQKTNAALSALEGPNIVKAKEELAEGMSLLHNRQKLIKLADKSEFGWATVQEYIDDELADDEADASKIKKSRETCRGSC